MIIVDHMGSFPSLYEPFTGGGRLLVSAAEGFFFLSGLLVGRLRGWDVRQGNFNKAKRWLVRRATVLFVVTVILTLSFTFAAWAFNYSPRVTVGVSTAGWLETVVRALTLQYSFGLADMLPLYAVYLLGSIGVLYLLAKGRWKLVLILSALLWVIPLATPGLMRPVGSYFSLLSWQLLFYFGMVLGFYNHEVLSWRQKISRPNRIKLLATVGSVALVGLALGWALRIVPGLYQVNRYWVEPLFSNIELSPGRLLFFFPTIIFCYHVVRHYEAKLASWFGWFFLPLGQQSLFVYALHSVLIFPFIGLPFKTLVPATIANTLMLAVIWGVTKQYQRLPSKHRYL